MSDEEPPGGDPPDPDVKFPPAEGEGDGAPAPLVPKPKDPGLYMPLIIMTAIFAAIFIIVPFFFRKGPNKGIIRCSIMIAAFSMWLFWVTVYIAQMNPLLGPRLKNTTLAWIGHTWGKNPKPPPPPVGEGGGKGGGEGGGEGGEEAPPAPPEPEE